MSVVTPDEHADRHRLAILCLADIVIDFSGVANYMMMSSI